MINKKNLEISSTRSELIFVIEDVLCVDGLLFHSFDEKNDLPSSIEEIAEAVVKSIEMRYNVTYKE